VVREQEEGMKTTTKAIILARVSTEDQAKDGKYSIPAQLRILREYVKKRNLEIVSEYAFDESASKDRREKFEEAIKRVEESEEPIAIVAEKVDRFQRSFRESVRFDELRKDGKVELHFVSNNLVIHRNSSASELMMWDAFVMFAKAYVQQLSDNVKRSIKEKLERKEFPGYVPVGYLNLKEPSKENPGTFIKKIVVDEERAPFVRKCFELYATGKYSMEKLATVMREVGFTQKTKKKRVNGKLIEQKPQLVNKNDIFSILQNPFYTGKFLWRDPETGERRLYDGNYPSIVEEKLYRQVQKVLKDYNTREKGFRKNRFKFQKMIKCAYCGCYLTGEEYSRTYKNKKAKHAHQVYYHCTSGKAIADPDYYKREFGTEKCPSDWWLEEEIEEAVLIQFKDIDYGEDVFEFMRDQIEKDYSERIEMVETQLKSLKAEMGQKETLIRNYMDSLVTEKDDELKEEMRGRLDSLKKERDELKEEIRILEDARDIDTDEVVEALSICFNLKEQYVSMETEKQRELLMLCFREIRACREKKRKGRGKKKEEVGGRLDFIWNEPFNTIDLINWEELAHISKENSSSENKFPIAKDREAFPNP
jgi:site-specific DNA recombinase